jgi:hypothetical protein
VLEKHLIRFKLNIQTKTRNRSFELMLISAEAGLLLGTAVTHSVDVPEIDMLSNALSYEPVARSWRTKHLSNLTKTEAWNIPGL